MRPTRPLLALLAAAVLLAPGFTRDAGASVTIDLLWMHNGEPWISITPGDLAGGGSRTMIVRMTSTTRLMAASVSVGYSTDIGLAVSSAFRWGGLKISKGIFFSPIGPLAESLGGPLDRQMSSFNAIVPPPNAPPSQAPGTYQIGTIIWDTSNMIPGMVLIVPFINPALDAFGNGDGNDITGSVTLNPARITPEPATVSLLGLGLVGLVLAARRRRASAGRAGEI